MSSERERHESESSDQQRYLVKLRGLTSKITRDDIKKFLHPCAIVTIHLFENNGEIHNECVVELETDVDVEDAKDKSGQYLGDKTIDVDVTSIYELNFYVKNKGAIVWNDPVLRIKGLPYACTMADVQNFFEGIEIARNGIYITRDMADKALGDGFVAFISMDNAYKALDLYHEKYLEDSLIQLFPASYEEAKRMILEDAQANAKQFSGEKELINENQKTNHRSRTRSRSRENRSRRLPPPPPPIRGNNYRRRSRTRSRSRSPARRRDDYLVKMRGMPFTVTQDDIRKFFPSSCQPVRIEIVQDRRMHRPNGDAYVYFNSFDDATEAMKCDRKYMGTRYIELYFDSPRQTSSTSSNQRRRRNPVSPVPMKSRSNHYRRSRSDSND